MRLTGGRFDQLSHDQLCFLEMSVSSNASVVRASSHDGSSIPLHSEERNGSEKPKYHHDQKLPVKEEVVAVEKGHSCTDGLEETR